MYAGACFVAGASVPARASLPLPTRERSVCITKHITCRCTTFWSARNPRTATIHVADNYGWCANVQHHLRRRRCMDSNPQHVMQRAGAHYHCRPPRCVDSNHLRVVRCAGAHHHPRPPQGKEACVKLRTYHNTHYVPVHNKAVNPPHGKEACVKMRAYHLSLIHI